MPSCQLAGPAGSGEHTVHSADGSSPVYPTLAAALYVVATPIGNLEDISNRAARTLRAATWIAAEDTRSSRPLLQSLGIGHARTLALHAHNEASQTGRLLDLIRDGASIALITDAGTPGLSDPGALLVTAAHEAGLTVVPVPGASAATTLLSAAGLPGGRFFFEGFLPTRAKLRAARLEALAASGQAFMLFEAPHRIEALASELCSLPGALPANGTAGREVVIGRELTKRFEQIVRMPLAALPDWLAADENHRRGEFALLVFGPPADGEHEDSKSSLTPLGLKAMQLLSEAMPPRQAAKLAARISGDAADALYQAQLARKK